MGLHDLTVLQQFVNCLSDQDNCVYTARLINGSPLHRLVRSFVPYSRDGTGEELGSHGGLRSRLMLGGSPMARCTTQSS